MASPFISKTFTFTQPDGTQFQVRGWGDQHYAVFETLDGYTVTRNPATGFYEIAQVSNDGSMLEPAPVPHGSLDGARAPVQPGLRINHEAARARGMAGALRMGGRRCDQRREQYRHLARAARTLSGPLMAPPQRQTVGDYVGLCLLIDFPDEPGTIEQDEVSNFCNQQGYSGFGNNGSVFDYFLDNSLGRCRYTNIVAEYYRAQHPKSHYTDPNIPQGTRARQLIVEALTHLSNSGFNFSALTADDQGFVYAMNVYYAGEVENNWAEGLWPHAWHLGTPFSLAPGKSAFDYQFTDMSHQLTLGTFCHENGHMLCDYPDLYDYGSESGGAGAYCLMCAGGNIDQKNPTEISAYLKRLSGWAGTVSQIQHNQQISLAAGENQFAMLAKTTGEYFIIENRMKNGRDASLPDEGLAIWHVDEDGDNSNEQMTPAQHYELSLEQADGEFRLESSPYHYGDATDLYGENNHRFADDTTPGSRWWDGSASNLEIFDISAPGPAVSFTARLSEEDGEHRVQGESWPNTAIPDNRAEGIVDTISLDQEGTILGVDVTLDISHTYRGDLRVTLLTPWADSIVLHQRHQGGSADDIRTTLDESVVPALADLRGRDTRGDWQLLVQDLAFADVGVLKHWALDFAVLQAPSGLVILEEMPGERIPDNSPQGIERVLNTGAAGTVDSVEISVDITHTWIADLRISLQSPDGTEVVLHDGGGGSADDVVKTYTASTLPALEALSGKPISGQWRLRVSDHARRDIGKLNHWRLVIRRAEMN